MEDAGANVVSGVVERPPRRETIGGLTVRLREEGRYEDFLMVRRELIAKTPFLDMWEATERVYDQFLPLDGSKTALASKPWSGGTTQPGRRRTEEQKAAKRAAKIGNLDEKIALQEKVLLRTSPDVDLGLEEITGWVAAHLSGPKEQILQMKPPSKATWNLFLWARENQNEFWRMFQGAKKKAGGGGEDQARRMEIDSAIRCVYDAARESVLDASELDRETFGLADLVRAREVMLKAERGESDFGGDE